MTYVTLSQSIVVELYTDSTAHYKCTIQALIFF